MRRTKLFLSAIVLFAVCLTGWTIVNNQQQREDDNFSKNVEALTLPPEGSGETSSGVYPRYINKTDRRTYSEIKTEVKKDSAGFSVSIDYKRECVSYYTYCNSTGNKEDMCYEKLNKFVTNCGNWSEK